MFIGKNLDHDALKRGFEKCVHTPEFEKRKLASLRFDLGDPVECNTSNGWVAGVVAGRMYRDNFMPPGGGAVPDRAPQRDHDLGARGRRRFHPRG